MNQTIKCKKPIIILLLVALVCKVSHFIALFFHYKRTIISSAGKYNLGYALTLEMPDAISLLYAIFSIVPYLLFALYILKFYQSKKPTVLYPILCGFLALSPLKSVLEMIDKWTDGFGVYSDIRYIIYDVVYDVAVIIMAVSFVLLTFQAIIGWNKKAFPILAVTLGLFCLLYQEILFDPPIYERISNYIKDEFYFSVFRELIALIAPIAFYVSLLLFSLNNPIPKLILTSRKKATLYPEESLQQLKEQFELGMITEEAYQKKKAEIINRL